MKKITFYAGLLLFLLGCKETKKGPILPTPNDTVVSVYMFVLDSNNANKFKSRKVDTSSFLDSVSVVAEVNAKLITLRCSQQNGYKGLLNNNIFIQIKNQPQNDSILWNDDGLDGIVDIAIGNNKDYQAHFFCGEKPEGVEHRLYWQAVHRNTLKELIDYYKIPIKKW
jgi:hypothetical protein